MVPTCSILFKDGFGILSLVFSVVFQFSFCRLVNHSHILYKTSDYATWFTAGGAIRIAHYDVIHDVTTRKL